MKKRLLSIIMLSGSVAIAQPVINSSVYPSVGTTVSYTEANSASLSEGSAGANQTWNFSGATSTGTVSTNEYVAAAGTPHAASFPGANICARVSDGMGDYFYSYYTHTASSTVMNGYGFNSNGTPVISVYSNPQTLFNYPSNYNGSFTDNFAGMYTTTVSGYTINQYRAGTITTVVDGYGSLTTPVGSYPSCQRMKISQAIVDSTVYIGLPIPTVISYFNATTYNWISAGSADRLNQFYLSYDTSNTQAGQNISKTAQYQSGLSTGINSFTPELLRANAYPNPALEHVMLVLDKSVNGAATLNIYDMNGRVVKQLSTEMKAADRFEWMFPVQELASGIYSAVITCSDKTWQLKITRE